MISLAYVALWIFVFAVPWENMVVFPGFGTISKALGVLALASTLIAALVSGRVRRLRLLHVSALLFVIWAGWATFRSPDQRWALYRFVTYLQLFLVLWMIWQLSPTVRRLRGLLLAYVLGAYVASLATILVYRAGSGTARRFAAAGFNANDLGTILALALPMAWYLGITYRQPIMRWVCRGYLPIGLVAIGLTASRGAMIVAVVALMIVPLTMTRLSPAKMAGAILVLFACGAVGVAYLPERSLERLSTTTSEVQGGKLGGRGTVWRMGFQAFIQRPLMGYGTASFPTAVRTRVGYGVVAHNTYLTILVEQGMVGFLPWATMFVAVFFQMLRMPSLERRFGLILLATLAIAILPLTWDDRKPVWFILAALAAFSEALIAGRVGAPMIQQPGPRRPMPITRQPLAPRARAQAAPRPPATPTGTPFHDA